MAEIDEAFQAAVERVPTLASDPGNEVKLNLYALYKQATVGDVQGKKPGFTDFVGKAKYEAWGKLKGMSSDAAKQQYVDLVAGLA
ncbi:MAG: acyl-CoA-binding protein [Candidatus Nanopelagicales bacterium]